MRWGTEPSLSPAPPVQTPNQVPLCASGWGHVQVTVNRWVYNGVGRVRSSLPSHRLRKRSLLNKYNEEVWKANISLNSFWRFKAPMHHTRGNTKLLAAGGPSGRIHVWTLTWPHRGHVRLLFTFNYVHLKVMELSFIFLCLIYVMLTSPACKVPLKTRKIVFYIVWAGSIISLHYKM